MNFVTGSDRQQISLLPPALEDYVSANNPVRFLEAFVAKLDLRAAGFKFPKADPQGRGRPSYDPAGRLKLYLYGGRAPARAGGNPPGRQKNIIGLGAIRERWDELNWGCFCRA